MIQSASHNLYGEGAHTGQSRVLLLSFFNMVLSVFSQSDTRRTSAPFRTRQILNLYPSHYRMAFAFSGISIQHLQQYALRFICSSTSSGRKYWVSAFRINNPMNDLGAPWTPVVLQFRIITLVTYNLTTYCSHKGAIFDLYPSLADSSVYNGY